MKIQRPNPIDALGALMITVLALALFAPAFPGLRAKQDARTCLSNLQRLGAAARMYEDDYDGRLTPYSFSGAPADGSPTGMYTALLYPYIRDARVFSCPADHLNENAAPPFPPYPTTYGVNWYISGRAQAGGSAPIASNHRSFVKEPARTIWAADSAIITKQTANLPPLQWREDMQQALTTSLFYFNLPKHPVTGGDGGWNGSLAGIARPFPRHEGRVNVCYYDGHAGSVPASQFDPNVTPWGAPECLWDNPVP